MRQTDEPIIALYYYFVRKFGSHTAAVWILSAIMGMEDQAEDLPATVAETERRKLK